MTNPSQPPPGPGWQLPPTPPPASPARKWKIAGIGCGGLLGAFIVLGIIGAIVGPAKTTSVSSPAGAVSSPNTAAATAPTAAVTTPPPPSPSVAPTTSKTTPPAAPILPSEAPTHLAPAANRTRAAAILHANNAYYQAEFNQGVTVTLNRGQPDSFPAFSAWQQKASMDVQPGTAAFTQADAQFNASDEPQSISDWRDSNGTLFSDLANLATDGLDVGGPDDATARPKIRADAAQFRIDFAAAEKDATGVGTGK